MKKYINGQYIELTNEEISAMESMQEAAYAESKSADITNTEKIAIFLSTITEDKTNKGDNGEVLTKAIFEDGVIKYVDSGYRLGTGTYEDPKQFVDGDAVTEGLYYCRCKVSAKGTVYRQLTSGTYKAYRTTNTATWGKMTDFEFAY